MGHAGMGISDLYPINSLESLVSCLNLGADGTEMDVQMTKDSVLVAFHDGALEESTTISGVVNDLTWSELREANYTNAPYGNYDVVRLDDIFSSISYYNERIFTFDIKLYSSNTDLQGYYDVFAEQLVSFYHKYDLFKNVYVESQTPDFLNTLRTKNSDILLYYYPQTFEDGFARAMQFGYRGISISNQVISAAQVSEAHANGLFVTIWGVETKDKNREAIQKNPDMIQTDKVEYLVELLK